MDIQQKKNSKDHYMRYKKRPKILKSVESFKSDIKKRNIKVLAIKNTSVHQNDEVLPTLSNDLFNVIAQSVILYPQLRFFVTIPRE